MSALETNLKFYLAQTYKTNDFRGAIEKLMKKEGEPKTNKIMKPILQKLTYASLKKQSRKKKTRLQKQKIIEESLSNQDISKNENIVHHKIKKQKSIKQTELDKQNEQQINQINLNLQSEIPQPGSVNELNYNLNQVYEQKHSILTQIQQIQQVLFSYQNILNNKEVDYCKNIINWLNCQLDQLKEIELESSNYYNGLYNIVNQSNIQFANNTTYQFINQDQYQQNIINITPIHFMQNYPQQYQFLPIYNETLISEQEKLEFQEKEEIKIEQ